MYRLARPWLFALDPEDSHDRALSALAFAARRRWARGALHVLYGRRTAPLPVRVMGIDFPNPLDWPRVSTSRATPPPRCRPWDSGGWNSAP